MEAFVLAGNVTVLALNAATAILAVCFAAAQHFGLIRIR